MSSSTPLVSVITNFLNGEQFLAEAIESVFGQTYGNWELLLVDDGSSDGSTAIAQHYAEQHPDCVRYLEHERHANRGMSARSEEHTSELQSLRHLVCRLLLEKKNTK